MPEMRIIAELRDAAAAGGCLVCNLLERDEKRFFEIFIYEQINDMRRRQQLQRSRGFCAAHTRALAGYEGAPMAAAIISRSLFGTLLQQDRQGRSVSGRSRRRLSTLLKGESNSEAVALRPQAPCPACDYLNGQTSLYLVALLAQVSDPGSPEFYTDSDGLCLPHLERAVSQSRSASATQALLEHQQSVWEELRDVLDEFLRKHDYRYRAEELTAEEQVVWRRALLLLASARSGRDEHDR